MASSATPGVRGLWGLWLAGAAAVAAGLLLVAWTTGAFATSSEGTGTCYDYAALVDAGTGAPTSCENPHTAESVAFLAPSLDRSGLQERCWSAVLETLDSESRKSRARSAYRGVLVDVQAPWRRTGVRCDVVRVEYVGVGGVWVPAVTKGSAAGGLADEPQSWAQCRELAGSQVGASVACTRSGRSVVELPFIARTKGGYRPDEADKAAKEACRAAAKGEVRKGAKPVRISEIAEEAWEAGSTATGRCTFTTKAWKFAGAP